MNTTLRKTIKNIDSRFFFGILRKLYRNRLIHKSIFWDYAIKNSHEYVLTRNTDHGLFSFYNTDQVIGKSLYVYNNFELDKLKQGLKILTDTGHLSLNKPILLDVGGNIGTVCIPLVKEGYFKQSLVFEPEPRNFELLEKNIKQNKQEETIKAFNIALSNEENTMQLKLSADNFGNHRIQVGQDDKKENTISVDAKRLDDVLEKNNVNFENIGLMWMDVEGHEKHVLEGATKLIEAKVPIVAEFWPYGLDQANVNRQEYASMLADSFIYFVDLADLDAKKQPISNFINLFEQYTGEMITDILLIS